MSPRSQRIIAVIIGAFIIAIIGYISLYPFNFDFDFASIHFESYWRPLPLPAWATLLSGLLVGLPLAILFSILWWRRRKQN